MRDSHRLGSRRSLGSLGAFIAVAAVCAVPPAAPSQDGTWLRPVTRLTGPTGAKDALAIAMTGDGAHVLVTDQAGVRVLPVAGGDAWRVPDVGTGANAVAFGNAAKLCAVDASSVVIADAAARTVVRRVELAQLELGGRTPTCLAVRPDGERAVLGLRDAKHACTGWLLDLTAATRTSTPVAPELAVWVHDGFVLLSGQPGTCGVLLDATWTWLPAAPPADGKAPASNPSRVWQPYADAIAAIPGRRELVHVWPVESANADDHGDLVGRVDPSTGAVLAEHKTDAVMLAPIRIVAGHVVSRNLDDHRLELRRLDDLRVLATALVPEGLSDIPLEAVFATAQHAPRVVFRCGAELTIFEVVPPANAAK